MAFNLLKQMFPHLLNQQQFLNAITKDCLMITLRPIQGMCVLSTLRCLTFLWLICTYVLCELLMRIFISFSKEKKISKTSKMKKNAWGISYQNVLNVAKHLPPCKLNQWSRMPMFVHSNSFPLYKGNFKGHRVSKLSNFHLVLNLICFKSFS